MSGVIFSREQPYLLQAILQKQRRTCRDRKDKSVGCGRDYHRRFDAIRQRIDHPEYSHHAVASRHGHRRPALLVSRNQRHPPATRRLAVMERVHSPPPMARANLPKTNWRKRAFKASTSRRLRRSCLAEYSSCNKEQNAVGALLFILREQLA